MVTGGCDGDHKTGSPESAGQESAQTPTAEDAKDAEEIQPNGTLAY